MNTQLLAMMNESEQDLARDVFDRDLRSLDEDELVVLHDRVRRARNKYSKLYRRRAAAKVKADRSRAKASAANQRTARKAEIFEDALARVSRSLARAAKARHAELRAERLASARGTKKPTSSAQPKAATPSLPGEKRKRRTGISKRSAAQGRAATRQKQAKRAAAR